MAKLLGQPSSQEDKGWEKLWKKQTVEMTHHLNQFSDQLGFGVVKPKKEG